MVYGRRALDALAEGLETIDSERDDERDAEIDNQIQRRHTKNNSCPGAAVIMSSSPSGMLGRESVRVGGREGGREIEGVTG